MRIVPRLCAAVTICATTVMLVAFTGTATAQEADTKAEKSEGSIFDSADSSDSAEKYTDLPSLFELNKKEALKGDAKAQADLGVKYLFGHGVAADANEAVKWFKESV